MPFDHRPTVVLEGETRISTPGAQRRRAPRSARSSLNDEPMVGLDPKSAFRLKEMMRSHCDKGNIVFFSTHVLEVAEKICDRVAIINKGKIIAQGTMEELRDADHK